MAKKFRKTPENIHDLSFTKRDEEIRKLEFQRKDVEEDLEDAIEEFIRITGFKSFKREKKRLSPLLQDAKDPDKMIPR